jgi:inositol transporter-like SP family MFS transporter
VPVDTLDPAPSVVAAKPWRVATLAGIASYLDAGTIVAVSASLSLWQTMFHMSAWEVGFLSGALTVCIGIGAVLGGRIGDRWGRKRVYSIDLLLYAFGLLWIIFAVGTPMLFVAAIVVGLAVGADVPTSLALVGEMSPADKRGRLVAFTQVLWSLGPLVVIMLVLLATGLGDLMPRVVFGHLFMVAIVTWFLRRRIAESSAWKRALRGTGFDRSRLKALFTRPLLRGSLFTIAFYSLLTIGTNFYGSFGLYALEKVGGLSASSALAASLIAVPVIAVTLLSIMRAMDTRARRPLFFVGAVIQVLSWVLLLIVPVSAATLIVAFVLYGLGTTMAGEAHYKIWSQEIFPTALRSSALGLSFGTARILSAIVLIFIPTLLLTGFTALVVLMIVVTLLSGLLGIIFMPHKQGESIEMIDLEFTAPSRL